MFDLFDTWIVSSIIGAELDESRGPKWHSGPVFNKGKRSIDCQMFLLLLLSFILRIFRPNFDSLNLVRLKKNIYISCSWGFVIIFFHSTVTAVRAPQAKKKQRSYENTFHVQCQRGRIAAPTPTVHVTIISIFSSWMDFPSSTGIAQFKHRCRYVRKIKSFKKKWCSPKQERVK